jgi:glucose-specific phosphotransferase system IIA component
MNLFWFNKKKEKTDNMCNKIHIQNIDSDIIYVPVRGKRIDLGKVEDKVFSKRIMGDGVAIEPEDNKVYSPVSGIIRVVFPTQHAIGIEAENGENIIIHVGIDTVELRGKGFFAKVKVDDVVTAGDLLMHFDLEQVSKTHKLTTMLVIEDLEEGCLEHNLEENLQVGNELMRIKRDKK